jgi:beta-aspartyl-peptidase (threonine type)
VRHDGIEVTASFGARGGAWAILVHGGAGDVAKERVALHVDGCRAAAAEGARVLREGGTAMDAAQRAVEVLEDDPCFNAGTGSCLNEGGEIELDASIMEGTGLRAGGVCALPPFLHPIAIARAVLEDGRHVLYAADGAERFAVAHGFARTTSTAMTTPLARQRWDALRAKASARSLPSSGGTVGAVARDAAGHVASATSTGGMIDKRRGRVGDSPIVGAGTYADDAAGACSNTGDGEAVIRVCLAKTAVEWMRGGMHPEDAARAAVRLLGARAGGTGGIILVDRHGQLGLARTTRTLTWAAAGEGLTDEAGA